MGKLKKARHRSHRRLQAAAADPRAVQSDRIQLRAHQRLQGDGHARAGRPLLQFVNGEADQLSDGAVPRRLHRRQPADSRGRRRACRERVEEIAELLEIDRDLHAPPPVRFSWGPLEFAAVIEKLSQKITMFHPDGTPARATLSVTFKEYRRCAAVREPRRESADKSKRRVVVGSDDLWLMAAREYDNPALWRNRRGKRPRRPARQRRRLADPAAAGADDGTGNAL